MDGFKYISGFVNPIRFLFDNYHFKKGRLEVVNSIPYSDLEGDVESRYLGEDGPVVFGHTLEDQIQGQIETGFIISGFYEDSNGGKVILDEYIKYFVATKADKR